MADISVHRDRSRRYVLLTELSIAQITTKNNYKFDKKKNFLRVSGLLYRNIVVAQESWLYLKEKSPQVGA